MTAGSFSGFLRRFLAAAHNPAYCAGLLVFSLLSGVRSLPAAERDTPAESEHPSPPPARTPDFDASQPVPAFDLTPAEMDSRLRDAPPPADGGWDYAAYQITDRLLTTAAELVRERGSEAFSDFLVKKEWLDLPKGRYIAVYEQDGRCIFNGAFPYRTGASFHPVEPRQLFTKDDYGQIFRRFGIWRNPQTGAYARQVIACLPVKAARDHPLLVCLHFSAPALPFDRHFAADLTREAAALLQRSGDDALAPLSAPSSNFRPLPGVTVLAADEKGTLLTTDPNLTGTGGESGDTPFSKTLKENAGKAREKNGVWIPGMLPTAGNNPPRAFLLHLQTAANQGRNYLVGCLLIPEELTQRKLRQGVKPYDSLFHALASAYGNPCTPPVTMKTAGLNFQSALLIPPARVGVSEEQDQPVRLYGAWLADYCYAAAFREEAARNRTGEAADKVWREQVRAGDRIEALGGLSLALLPAGDPEAIPNLWRNILNRTLGSEEYLPWTLNLLYGNFVENLFITSRLSLTGKPEQTEAAMREIQKQGRAVSGLLALGKERDLPAALRLGSSLSALNDILNKEKLNPADQARLREESARLRAELLRGN